MVSQFNWSRVVFGATLAAMILSLVPGAAIAGKGKEHKVRGKVIAMTIAADGTGALTLQIHKHKDAPAAGTAPVVETKTFQIGPGTVYEAVTAAGTNPVTVAAIHKGEHVLIKASHGSAETVEIVAHKHQHKAAVVAN
jgi:hypothetical protein